MSHRQPANQPPVRPNDTLTREKLVEQLGALFLACEGFMIEMRSKEAFHGLSNEFAETMLTTRDMLSLAGHKTIANRQVEPLTYTRDED